MIWVYAICERAAPSLPTVSGLGGAPLEAICEGPLLAVASRADLVPDEISVDVLSAHERVVEALMKERAVLPMRFGTRFAAAGDVQAALAARRTALLDALDRVRGRVELAVRARRPATEAREVAVAAGADGHEYVRVRLRASRSAASLHQPLAALAVASRRWPSLAPGELLRASYLVERPAVVRFRDTVLALQREHPEAALVCTGPWPAYSFMDEVSR
jgi:Gas vesicle synthesis protein GvpL/GvpF